MGMGLSICRSIIIGTASTVRAPVIWFPPGEKHWHGAAATTAMTHIAIVEQLNGKSADWMEKVSDDQYVLPVGSDHALMPSLLTLSDVMGTGHHAARMARVDRGKKVAVVGDGAVGLCGVIAAKRFGAEQIIILGHHPDRIALAKAFGATDVVSERGEEANERVRALTGGFGAHSVLECVGSEQAMRTALSIVRPGGTVGRVGVPHYEGIPGTQEMFYDNISVGGGPAPVRARPRLRPGHRTRSGP